MEAGHAYVAEDGSRNVSYCSLCTLGNNDCVVLRIDGHLGQQWPVLYMVSKSRTYLAMDFTMFVD